MGRSESGQMYGRALRTMRDVVDALRDLPDPDGAIAALVARIERERSWVAVEMRLSLPAQPPPQWITREGAALARTSRR